MRAANSGYWLAYALALSAALPDARAAVEESTRDAVRSGLQLVVVDNLMAEITIALAANDLDLAARRVPEVFGMYRDQQRWADLGDLLWVAAEIESKRGAAERSAVLMGASQRWTYQLDFQNELLLPDLANLRDRLTASLGFDAFADAAQRGATMELADVAGFLAVTRPAPLPSA
jgi:hypothetical protein